MRGKKIRQAVDKSKSRINEQFYRGLDSQLADLAVNIVPMLPK